LFGGLARAIGRATLIFHNEFNRRTWKISHGKFSGIF
jgi:hypothetical protein